LSSSGQHLTTIEESLARSFHGVVCLLISYSPVTREAHLARLYQPVIDAGLLTEAFFDDLRDEIERLRLMDTETHELEELETALVRRSREVTPENRLGDAQGARRGNGAHVACGHRDARRFRSQTGFRGWVGDRTSIIT
jgi:hypothetical protein